MTKSLNVAAFTAPRTWKDITTGKPIPITVEEAMTFTTVMTEIEAGRKQVHNHTDPKAQAGFLLDTLETLHDLDPKTVSSLSIQEFIPILLARFSEERTSRDDSNELFMGSETLMVGIVDGIVGGQPNVVTDLINMVGKNKTTAKPRKRDGRDALPSPGYALYAFLGWYTSMVLRHTKQCTEAALRSARDKFPVGFNNKAVLECWGWAPQDVSAYPGFASFTGGLTSPLAGRLTWTQLSDAVSKANLGIFRSQKTDPDSVRLCSLFDTILLAGKLEGSTYMSGEENGVGVGWRAYTIATSLGIYNFAHGLAQHRIRHFDERDVKGVAVK